MLGTGTPGQPGTLAAAAAAVHAAPQAVQEFDREVVLPAVKDFVEGVVTVAKDAQVQVGNHTAGRCKLGVCSGTAQCVPHPVGGCWRV